MSIEQEQEQLIRLRISSFILSIRTDGTVNTAPMLHTTKIIRVLW